MAASTTVTYTPTWASLPPWVLASDQVKPLILSLEANHTALGITAPSPTDVIFNGIDGVPLHINPNFTTSSIGQSDGTATSPIITAPAPSPSDVHPSAESSSDVVATEKPSPPTNGSTQTSTNPATATRTESPAVKDHAGLSSG